MSAHHSVGDGAHDVRPICTTSRCIVGETTHLCVVGHPAEFAQILLFARYYVENVWDVFYLNIC